MLVRTEESVVSARAASARRSRVMRFTSSAARCWASAALPPLPQRRIFPPDRKHSAIASTIVRIVLVSVAVLPMSCAVSFR